jgi:hypothetical protein
MFAVQHHYKYDAGRKLGSVLIALRQDKSSAIQLADQLYANSKMPGRDWVTVTDEAGAVVHRIEVDYMAQFEALPGMSKDYPSKSNPKKSYKAQVNTTGIVSCNCVAWAMGWKRNPHPGTPEPYRHCKHTDDLIRSKNVQVEVNGQYMMRIDPKIKAAKGKFAGATGPAQKFAILVREYEEAISIMAALEPGEMYQAAAAVEMAKFKVEAYMALLEVHGIDGSTQFLAAEAKLQEVVARQ